MSEAVIFIGIPASGKSTFYQQRFAQTHVHINLDTLKTRSRETRLLLECIENRQPFVVDNTNVLTSDRARYIALAKPAGFAISGYFFATSLGEALRRNQQRVGKAAIPAKGLAAKAKLLQLPDYAEGFDQLWQVRIDRQNEFVVTTWEVYPPRPA